MLLCDIISSGRKWKIMGKFNKFNFMVLAQSKNLRLTGDEFFNWFSHVFNLNLPDNMAQSKKLGLLLSHFGCVSSMELLSVGCPYEYDEINKQSLFKLISREIKAGKIKKLSLKHLDGTSRSLYGLTKLGYKQIEKFKRTRGCLVETGHILPTYHTYALSFALMTLMQNKMDIGIEFEVVSEADHNGFNKAKSFRADAIVSYHSKKFYIEQDMGTETIGKVAGKMLEYRDPDKIIILASHKPVMLKRLDEEYIRKIKKAEGNCKNAYDLIKNSENKELADVIRMLIALTKKSDISQLVQYSIVADERISEFIRIVKLYQNSQNRKKSLVNHIIKNKKEREYALFGMHIYCIPSELMYFSMAFRRDDIHVLESVYKNVRYYEERINVAGISFDGYGKTDKETVVVEYPEEDACSVVRILHYVRNKDAAVDVKIVAYVNTVEYAYQLSSMICEGIDSVAKSVLVIICEGDSNIYAARFGKLVPVGHRKI